MLASKWEKGAIKYFGIASFRVAEIQYCVRFILVFLQHVYLLRRSNLYQALKEASLKEKHRKVLTTKKG